MTGGPADGRALVELRELVRFYAGVETDFVLTLVLRAQLQGQPAHPMLSPVITALEARLNNLPHIQPLDTRSGKRQVSRRGSRGSGELPEKSPLFSASSA